MKLCKIIFLILPVIMLFTGTGIAEEITAKDVARDLMCINCPSELASVCPCPGAKQMREYITQALKEGKSKEDIKRYYVEQYGERILAAPPARGFNLLAWLLPIISIFGGLIFILLVIIKWVKRRNRRISIEISPQGDSANPEETLYRERLLRELEEMRKENQ